MAEEDEIDVLGDISLDNLLSKQEREMYGPALVSQNLDFLNYDYTIHPQWLLDKPSANPDIWYNNSNCPSGSAERLQTEFASNLDNIGHVVTTENSISDESGWTEKEKNLLVAGIDIFGKSNIRLAQFIGSKTASEVKYYLKNFYTDLQATNTLSNNISETNVNSRHVVINDTQIPASIEKVIAAVSNSQPKKSSKKSTFINFEDSEYNSELYFASALKSGKEFLENKMSKHISKKNCKGKSLVRKLKQTPNRNVKFKIKTKVKVDKRNLIKPKVIKVMNEVKGKPRLEIVEITTGKGLSVPICEGEEIVKIQKEDNSASDSEIDIDIEGTENVCSRKKVSQQSDVVEELCQSENVPENMNTPYSTLDLVKLDKKTTEQILSTDLPTCELHLDPNFVSNLEKIIHKEFFEENSKSSTKTPPRYLQLRNHIINKWRSQKPKYLYKTLCRTGLSNLGDVHCLGRIHNYLEQIGAINFGCDQTEYKRPLYTIIENDLCNEKRKKIASKTVLVSKPIKDLGVRKRRQKKFDNNGEGGCTLTHGEQGEVINTTIVNEEPVVKQKQYAKIPVTRLIYCQPFSVDKPQKYNVKMHLSALLLMDFHAHTSLSEVMGLLGGFWSAKTKTLTVTHYESCKNVASSATHCDMCPISQAAATDSLHRLDLDILGWFHSHPTFAPEPSQQDMETQQSVQKWIGINKPCIGVILSPFSVHGTLMPSPYRCMIVDKYRTDKELVPYRFKIELISESFDLGTFLENLKKIYCFESQLNRENRSLIDFNKTYFRDQSMTFLDKFISSVKMHLAKCSNFNKTMCDTIVQAIMTICNGER